MKPRGKAGEESKAHEAKESKAKERSESRKEAPKKFTAKTRF